MKVLIAHDGSEFSDAAIIDLQRAGLPDKVEAVVLSVADQAVSVAKVAYATVEIGLGGVSPFRNAEEEPDGHEMQTCEGFAQQAADRLRVDFPNWKIETETWVDCPESAIIRKAHGWQPDLIVLGAHGHSSLSRRVLGTVSQHVLHHTQCSVRISRHHLHPQKRPIQLIIGVDGSPGSLAAAKAVAVRTWPAGTEARVVGVITPPLPGLAALVPHEKATEVGAEMRRTQLAACLREVAAELAKSGLGATPELLAGKPGHVLIEEADRWGADCIFVGACGTNPLKAMLLGDVSDHVASCAHCSVEVVRPAEARK